MRQPTIVSNSSDGINLEKRNHKAKNMKMGSSTNPYPKTQRSPSGKWDLQDDEDATASGVEGDGDVMSAIQQHSLLMGIFDSSQLMAE
ncbi:hypothetical protein FQN57_000819 [Myotisia sp. PD_48]|nr:hypothetical protein FQN57_000819 [Myotisia sp. PD_48]